MTNGHTADGGDCSVCSSGGAGGGIQNFGTLTLTGVAVSGNRTGNGGNGIGAYGGGGLGGGIDNSFGTLTISNSTITANTASGSGIGGGIRIISGVITLRSTIVAGNSAMDTPDFSATDEFGATVQSDGFNLIGITSDATITQNPGAGPDITGQDPKLSLLANFGGPTDTHALLPDSPAIDKGKNFATLDNGDPLFTNQGSLPRPDDLNDSSYPNAAGGDGSDIGAYEYVDSDGDGVPREDDNCPDTPNPGQADPTATGSETPVTTARRRHTLISKTVTMTGRAMPARQLSTSQASSSRLITCPQST